MGISSSGQMSAAVSLVIKSMIGVCVCVCLIDFKIVVIEYPYILPSSLVVNSIRIKVTASLPLVPFMAVNR